MPHLSRISLSLIAISTLTACASRPTTPPTPTPLALPSTQITGIVTAADYSPMAADGDAIITVETTDKIYTILIPARENLCQASFPPTNLKINDQIQASGPITTNNTIRPCDSAEDYIKLL